MTQLTYTGTTAPVEILGHIFAPATNPHAVNDDAASQLLAVAGDVLTVTPATTTKGGTAHGGK